MEDVSASSLFSLLWICDCFMVKNVDLKSLFGIGVMLSAFWENSAKYSCFKAFSAVILSFGSYASNLDKISFKSLGQALGRNLFILIPFLGGKLIYIWDAWALNLYRTSGLGVPRTLWILLTWSSSSFPGNKGFLVISSKRTQPKPQISIF